MRQLSPLLLLAATLACNPQHRTTSSDVSQSCFRITFGLTDANPADWSGSLTVQGGRLAGLREVRFDENDKLDSSAGSWTCHTRRKVMPDPRDWFVGAKHTIPSDLTPPVGAMIPNALDAVIESGSGIAIHTAQGDAQLALADVKFGVPVKLLGGRVQVERVPQPSNLTAGDGSENDEPAVSESWLAWIAYRAEKEKLMVARTNGADRQSLAEGEFLRPALAGNYLAVSMRDGDTWKIAVSRRQNDRWGALDPVSSGGPDLFPAAAIDTSGNLWIAWQGFRDGRSRILTRRFDGKSWGPETAVSENTSDAWMPSIAAGANGLVHYAWDAYDDGVFNIYYRSGTNPMRRVQPSQQYQAYASIACGGNGDVWLAWEEAGPNWGKDTGFLVREHAGTALY